METTNVSRIKYREHSMDKGWYYCTNCEMWVETSYYGGTERCRNCGDDSLIDPEDLTDEEIERLEI